MRDIAYIVRDEIVNKMDSTIVVSSIDVNDLTICGTLKWAAVNKIVKDSLDNEYMITAVDTSTNVVTVSPQGAYVFTGTILHLNVPKYFTGTPNATDTEWRKFTDDEREKTPFIWLVEPTSETFFDDDSSGAVGRESNIHVVFLDSNNVEDWLTLDTHDNRLQSLYNMRAEFVKTIRDNYTIFESVSSSSVRNLTKFGTETKDGFEANIIAANLTGVDNRLTLSIYKKCDTNC